MTPEQIMALAFQDELEKIAGLPAYLRGMSAEDALLRGLPDSVVTRIALKRKANPSLSTVALRSRAGRITTPGETLMPYDRLFRDPSALRSISPGGSVGMPYHLANLRRSGGISKYRDLSPRLAADWRNIRAEAMGASDKVQDAYARRLASSLATRHR